MSHDRFLPGLLARARRYAQSLNGRLRARSLADALGGVVRRGAERASRRGWEALRKLRQPPVPEGRIPPDLFAEARRHVEICNACRYCEGYCAVFPAIARERGFGPGFPDGDLAHLANLCHNCRGCYYACPYTEPHEYALNLPGVLAELRHESWKAYAWPRRFAVLFDRSGVAVALILTLSVTLLFGLALALRPETGRGFYAFMSHGLMMAIFTPAFALPLAAVAVSLRGYWKASGAGRFTLSALWRACLSAGRMRNLSGGHGDGCNYEDGDRWSNRRRWFHQAALYGFLLCFASTSSATVLHYGFGLEAPYDFLSLPKLLGVPGGVLLCAGSAGLLWLKPKADRTLGAVDAWDGRVRGGEAAFTGLLLAVGLSGLALWAAGGTGAVPVLLALHLGAVLTFFLLMPYSKMAHGFYRFAALCADEVGIEEAGFAGRRAAQGEVS